jgi:chromosome segregation ATPase
VPKGITQEQVNAAADDLVAAGDKPTVEKIRQALGTGSPNTVTRMLNHWRERLGQRLQEVIKLPDVPSEVGQAFAEVWRLSLGHAEALARAALTEEQNALFADQTSLTQERKVWEIALAEAQAHAADCAAQYAQAHAQLQERQALVDQLEGQRVDLMQQRYRLTDQLEQQHVALETLRTEHSAAQAHIRAVEDRAHQQIDQARQEVKALQQRLEREQREHDKRVARLATQHEELQAAMRTAEQAAAHQSGRIAALEATIAQWRSTSTKRAAHKSSSAAKTKQRSRSGKVPP